MAAVGRIFVIVFALLLASVAAGLVITLAVLMPEWSALDLGPMDQGAFGLMLGFGAVFLSGFALLPALVVIVIGEAFSIRTLLYYAAAGAAAAALLGMNLNAWNSLAFQVDGFARRELEIMAAAGIVGGWVYWAVAGRKAGAWRAAQTPAEPT